MSRLLDTARTALQIEISSLESLLSRIGEEFEVAARKILACDGKVVFAGVGKSGHVGKKLAATFASTGTPSFFVHPTEGLHGDSGMVESNDLVIAISNSGETAELLAFCNIVRKIGAEIIAMTGGAQSSLANMASVTLDIGVEKEADPLNLAPTSSTIVTMALGDALAAALMTERGFTKEQFARFHPGGALGESLRSHRK